MAFALSLIGVAPMKNHKKATPGSLAHPESSTQLLRGTNKRKELPCNSSNSNPFLAYLFFHALCSFLLRCLEPQILRRYARASGKHGFEVVVLVLKTINNSRGRGRRVKTNEQTYFWMFSVLLVIRLGLSIFRLGLFVTCFF